MFTRVTIHSIALLSLLIIIPPFIAMGGRQRSDNFQEMVKEIAQRNSAPHSGIYVSPSDADLRDWTSILISLKSRSYDSCRMMLARQNYSLVEIEDALGGNVYDVMKEKYPVHKGWGTFVFNRNHQKRLNVEVNHPYDDAASLAIGAELFRHSRAEWLLVAGTSKLTSKVPTDMGRVKQSVYQHLHEMLTDLTHISVSVHSISNKSNPLSISNDDVIVSNGKTSDDQWGISQISLAFRDSMQASGFRCALAMYDSGYASLAGGWNVQGLFSNDSTGFGHWMFVIVSNKFRQDSPGFSKLVGAIDRSLEITGMKISQQVNRAFGLVSPRVVRIDSLHHFLFAPENSETYRIVALNSENQRNDTLDVRLGNWLELLGGQRSMSSVSTFDSTNAFSQRLQRRNASRRNVFSRVVTERPGTVASLVDLSREDESDSALSDASSRPVREPLQVHRIPLQPVLASTISNAGNVSATLFRWGGVVPLKFTPGIQTFEINPSATASQELDAFPKYLIPLINSSYRPGQTDFIGVQMTDILVHEIARLVSEQPVRDTDVGLLAEQTEAGDYYLRIFPTKQSERIAANRP